MALILVGDGGGRVQSVSTGVIIRSDGIVLTAYHPLKGAQEVQVRLSDGEIYDQVDLMGFDERRDVAALALYCQWTCLIRRRRAGKKRRWAIRSAC